MLPFASGRRGTSARVGRLSFVPLMTYRFVAEAQVHGVAEGLLQLAFVLVSITRETTIRLSHVRCDHDGRLHCVLFQAGGSRGRRPVGGGEA